MRLTEKQYKQILGHHLDSKYHNNKVVVDDIKFDSKKEAKFYNIYKYLERAKEIRGLKRQVPFVLQESYILNGKKIREIKYIADFTFYDKNNKFHIVDVKSPITRKNPVYRLKKKMLGKKYGIEIEEK